MPIISRFFGIIITMNYREHGPPHFHVWYAGAEVTVDIEHGTVTGGMSRRALALVLEWRELNRSELMENWKLAGARQPLKQIDPLE